MKRLVIQNEWDLLSLRDMLIDIPYYLDKDNGKLSAISEDARSRIIEKIDKIQREKDNGKISKQKK